MTDFLQLSLSGISLGTVYGLIAVGIVAVFSVTGVLNMAQGEFTAVAGLLAVTFTLMGWPLAVAMLMSIAAVSILGLVVQRTVSLSPNLGPLTSIILTLGVATVLKGIMLIGWGPAPRSLTPLSDKEFMMAGVSFRVQELAMVVIGLSVLGLAYAFYERTLLGKALRACHQEPTAARLVGISVRSMAAVSFIAAGFLGAVAGVLSSPLYLSSWESGTVLGLKGFVVAALAGMHSVRAAILAGLALGLAETMIAGYVDSGLKDAVAFFALIAVLLVRQMRSPVQFERV